MARRDAETRRRRKAELAARISALQAEQSKHREAAIACRRGVAVWRTLRLARAALLCRPRALRDTARPREASRSRCGERRQEGRSAVEGGERPGDAGVL